MLIQIQHARHKKNNRKADYYKEEQFLFFRVVFCTWIDSFAGSGHPTGHTERRRRRRSLDSRRRNGSSFLQGQRISATKGHMETWRWSGHCHPQWISSKTERYYIFLSTQTWYQQHSDGFDLIFKMQFQYSRAKYWHSTRSPDQKWERICVVSSCFIIQFTL